MTSHRSTCVHPRGLLYAHAAAYKRLPPALPSEASLSTRTRPARRPRATGGAGGGRQCAACADESLMDLLQNLRVLAGLPLLLRPSSSCRVFRCRSR
jgi:hypothetical protein